VITSGAGQPSARTGLSLGDRSLWLGLDRAGFYDERRVAMMGMGFAIPDAIVAALG
jgi:hypothetical protein